MGAWSGKRLETDEVATGGAKRVLHPPRLGDAGECDMPPGRRPIGGPARDPHRLAREDRQQIGVDRRHIGRQHDSDRVGAGQSRRQRLPQRPRRDHRARAERPFAVPGLAIDDHDRQRLGHGRVLMAVVHHHDIGATGDSQAGAGQSVAGDHHGSGSPQQQGFVTDIAGGMRVSDEYGSAQPAAVAGGQQSGL